MIDTITKWTKENKPESIVAIVCVTVLIGLAMYFGLDLSWIPAMLTRLIGG